MGVSLSYFLLSFIFETNIIYNIWGLKSPSFEQVSVLYITPIYSAPVQELMVQGI